MFRTTTAGCLTANDSEWNAKRSTMDFGFGGANGMVKGMVDLEVDFLVE